MTFIRKVCAALCVVTVFLCGASVALAQSQAAEGDMTVEAFMAQLHPQHGDIKLSKGNAELHLSDKYYFLNAEDAKRVIVEAWGNPPSGHEDVLGMVVAEGSNPVDDWGAIVTYEETFYVSDKDVDKTDYDKMIKQIHDAEPDNNTQRQKEGFGTVHLVGWAQPPTYDKVHHTLIWAQDLQLSTNATDTLNYDLRLLGRHGVLSLNMVDLMPNLPKVREQAKNLALAGVFMPGSRYEDYEKGDKKAAYGVGGLVAAGLGLAAAKKFGLLAILLLVAKKGWIVIVAGMAAVKAWWGKLFGKKSTVSPAASDHETVADAEVESAVVAPVESRPTIEDASPHRRDLDS